MANRLQIHKIPKFGLGIDRKRVEDMYKFDRSSRSRVGGIVRVEVENRKVSATVRRGRCNSVHRGEASIRSR